MNPPAGPKDIRTLGGLYVAIFRLASRNAHATVESMDPWIREEPRDRWVVTPGPRASDLTYSALAVPLYAMALVVASERLGWPDEADVRAINDSLTREDPATDEGT